MPLLNSIRSEFSRSPITVSSTVISVVIAAVGLLLAWRQNTIQLSATSSSTPETLASSGVHLGNLSLAVSFFIAVSFLLATAIKLLEKSAPFPAMILSVPAAILSSFLTLLIIKLAPPKNFTPQALAEAKDIVFYGTVFVFLAINGRKTLKDLAEAESERDGELSENNQNSSQGGSFIVFAFLLLIIWGGLVSAGLTKLFQLLIA